MAIADDIGVAINGDIRYCGTTANYTVLELHRFLQDLADDAVASGDDLLDITDTTPSDRSTDNIITLLPPYNIDDTLSEHLYDGSITQTNGDTVYSGLRVLGAVNNSLTTLQIIQNNAVISPQFWGDQSTGGYNGIAASGVLMRILLKTRDAAADIDGKRVRVQARHWGDSYDFFNVTLGQGESVAAISTTPDAQNTTDQSGATAYTGVTNIEGYQLIDLNNGAGTRPYYSQWTYGNDDQGDGLKSIWEFTKDLTGTGTAKTIHGVNGEIFLGVTHEYTYDTETGNPFIEDDVMTWGAGATAGTGLLLALDDPAASGVVWFQLLTGVAPTAGLTINNEAADGTHDVIAISSKTIPKHFLGSYTGTLIGAFGIGIDPDDLTAADTVQDLSGTTQTPPNNVTFSVTSIVSTEDRVLVGPETGSTLNTSQLQSVSAHTAGQQYFEIKTTIPSDTPATGTVRAFNGNTFDRLIYSGYTGPYFLLSGATNFLPNNIADQAPAFISYIDKLADATSASFTTVFSTSRDLFIRVRDGGGTPIKTFETPATLGTAGGSVAAIRTTDE
jgi:hypothetical protein